jgi:hypothetical protein
MPLNVVTLSTQTWLKRVGQKKVSTIWSLIIAFFFFFFKKIKDITDHETLDKILSLWPSALLCLNEDNLKSLIKLGARSLAETTVAFMVDKVHDVENNNNGYCTHKPTNEKTKNKRHANFLL